MSAYPFQKFKKKICRVHFPSIIITTYIWDCDKVSGILDERKIPLNFVALHDPVDDF